MRVCVFFVRRDVIKLSHESQVHSKPINSSTHTVQGLRLRSQLHELQIHLEMAKNAKLVLLLLTDLSTLLFEPSLATE